jgi:alkylated DNA repair dioxygenase AlkB
VHSNDEKTLEKIVPSPLSFGAEQNFQLSMSKLNKRFQLYEHGSLLIMKDATQTN